MSLVTLTDLLSQADFVTLHVNVTPATRGLINAQRLALMKNSAYLINTSRAAVIDEPALINALQQHQIAGAGLDVYAQEPIRADHPYIRQLTNVTLTPHIAGATYEVLTNHMQMIISDIQRFLAGEALLYRYLG